MKNNRTFLEKLLDGAGVEWKTIAEISNKVSSGGTPTTSNNNYYENGNIPWLRTQEVDFKEIWNTDLKITEEGLNNSSAKWIPKNCVIVAMYGATVGKIAINKIPLTTNQACANIEVNPEIAHYRYVFHYLMSKYEYIKSLGSGSQTNINSQIVKKIRIPIPPLSVQIEIVKILDALTALTSELTSELVLRQKQYEYYREKLLSFDSLEQLNSGGGEKKLIDVAYFQNGKGHEKNIDENGSFIVINSKFISTNGTVKKYCNDQLVPLFKEDILIVMSDLPNGKALAKTFFVTEDNKYTLNQRIGRIKVKEGGELLPSFVNHFLNRNKQLTKYDNGTDQTNLRKDQILDVVIPIPPLEQQQRIVSILDKFETLTHSISEGLPLAIEQSQKRYEYYRELLLNFS